MGTDNLAKDEDEAGERAEIICLGPETDAIIIRSIN